MNNRIENLLSRVVSLEECFDSLPIDMTDQRRRFESIRYVAVLLYSRCSFLLASSMASRGNYGRCLRSRGYLGSLITFKTTVTCSGLSTTSKMRSSTIGFVHNLSSTLFSTLMTTADCATEGNLQPAVRTDSESFHSRSGTRNDLSAGPRLDHLLALTLQMTIA